jgi:hypothetical protein
MASESAGQYGSRLMASIVDEQGTNNAERIFSYVPRTADVADGFQPVTFGQLKNAVDYAVCWLRENFGGFAPLETLCYVGVSDLRYNVLFYAALKLRVKVLTVDSAYTFMEG